MLKVGDIWVSPLEVENRIKEHPSVREVAVVGLADDKGLTKPKAFIVLKEGAGPSPKLEEDIMKWVRDRLAPYKCPLWAEFVKELPKGATGKIRRPRLR
jgi:4-hydroxybenzoate-CoA ligase